MELFSVITQEISQHDILGGINYCNVMVAAVLHGKPEIFRLQLQFFPRCCVGNNYCNVTRLLYRNLLFQNIICNNFASNGIPNATLNTSAWTCPSMLLFSDCLHFLSCFSLSLSLSLYIASSGRCFRCCLYSERSEIPCGRKFSHT